MSKEPRSRPDIVSGDRVWFRANGYRQVDWVVDVFLRPGYRFWRVRTERGHLVRVQDLSRVEYFGARSHLWVDGPDGAAYHCSRCEISKTDDHDGYTCRTWSRKVQLGQIEALRRAVARAGPSVEILGWDGVTFTVRAPRADAENAAEITKRLMQMALGSRVHMTVEMPERSSTEASLRLVALMEPAELADAYNTQALKGWWSPQVTAAAAERLRAEGYTVEPDGRYVAPTRVEQQFREDALGWEDQRHHSFQAALGALPEGDQVSSAAILEWLQPPKRNTASVQFEHSPAELRFAQLVEEFFFVPTVKMYAPEIPDADIDRFRELLQEATEGAGWHEVQVVADDPPPGAGS